MCGELPAGGGGLAHSAVVYDNDDQLLDVAVPFLREGVDAEEPTLLSIGGTPRELILDSLGDATGITELPAWTAAQAFVTLRSNHRLITEQARNGASHVRILGEVPYRDEPASWGGWVRYEAAINHVYADLAVSLLCPYDRRLARSQVLDDIARTHPTMFPNDAGNSQFVRPDTFLADLASRDIDPVEVEAPAIELVDQRPRVFRSAVAALAATTELTETTTDALVLAVGEIVTNAILCGRPPVVVRAWATPDRVVVTVRDHGDGLADPFIGMLPVASAPTGGLGLHIAYQACTLVTMTRGPGSFTVHLTMRQPSVA
jgi:anti-sigma regulatory factor (Ser/Thr protein kinase)